MIPPTLVTTRLILRPLQIEDAEALYPMYHDPQAIPFLLTPGHADTNTTRKYLAGILQPAACHWLICRRADERPIGTIGYLDTQVPRPGMGYYLNPDSWRQGVMTEAARVVLDYGFTHLQLDRVELWINQENIPSQRLAEKLGFTRRGHFQQKFAYDAAVHEKLVFGMYRHEWIATANAAYPQTPRFDAVQPQLAVTDVTTTATYYRDQLGFTIEWLGEEPAGHGIVAHRDWMATGVCIHFQRVTKQPATRGIVLRIDVGSNIEALYMQYVARGIRIATPITTQPWGSREFAIADLNGYQLLFTALC